jgi:hypothetical protein
MAVARIPYTLLFGPDGTVSWRLVGYSPQMSRALNSAVAKALAAAPEKPAEQGSPEKPTENVTPEKPSENVTPEKPTENVTPEKPAGQVRPKKKTCNCPCHSSPASGKKTE